MQAIILQIVGLLIITTLIILFFSKPNIESIETKIYSKLIWLNFLFLVIGISTYIVAKLTGNINMICVLQKFYMCILALLNLYSMNYCISIYDKEVKLGNFKKILSIITSIAILLIIILPLNVILEGDLLDGEGLAYNVALGHTILSFIFFFIITIILLIKKYSIKKITPYIVLIILYLVGFLIRGYFKELIFEGFFYSYILFIMYNIIENPDVKMAKELIFQKQLVDYSSKKTIDLIKDMSKDLSSSIDDLESFSNIKINKNNIEELNNILIKFQEDSIKLSNKISNVLDLTMIKSDSKTNIYKYETIDMLDRIKKLLLVENDKINIEISDKLSAVLYGNEENVIKTVLYFYDLIFSMIHNRNITLLIDDIKVGNFSRLRFKFITDDDNILNYLKKDKKTGKLEFKIEKNINYQIIESLLVKVNGKITIVKNKSNINLILSIDQRLISEYEVISRNEENKNIKIKYHNYDDKRVLIVDNNDLRIKNIKILLKPYNIETISVKNMDELGDVLNNNETYDLIIIDDIIPNFMIDEYTKEIVRDEYDIINYIKRQAKYNIKTIIMVTQNNRNLEEKYIKYGFNDYIIKPINKKNIDKILNKYFSKNHK